MNEIIQIEATEVNRVTGIHIPSGKGNTFISEIWLRGLQRRVLSGETISGDSKLIDALISYIACNHLS